MINWLPSIRLIHLKDRKKDDGPNTVWGEGDTPIKPVLQLLKTKKYNIPANIEFEYRGEDSVGCQLLTSNRWQLQWMEAGKLKSKSFSARKYGHWEAKKTIETHRKTIYPNWEKPAEEDFTDALMMIEI